MSCSRATLAHIFFMLFSNIFSHSGVVFHREPVRHSLDAEAWDVFACENVPPFLGIGRWFRFASFRLCAGEAFTLFFSGKRVGGRQNDLHPPNVIAVSSCLVQHTGNGLPGYCVLCRAVYALILYLFT